MGDKNLWKKNNNNKLRKYCFFPFFSLFSTSSPPWLALQVAWNIPFFLFSLLFPLVICLICIKVVVVVLCVQLHSILGIWSLGIGLLTSFLAGPKSQPSWKLSLPVLTFQGLRFKEVLGFTDKWKMRRNVLDNGHEITSASTLLMRTTGRIEPWSNC